MQVNRSEREQRGQERMGIDAERTDKLAQLKEGSPTYCRRKSHDEEHVDV